MTLAACGQVLDLGDHGAGADAPDAGLADVKHVPDGGIDSADLDAYNGLPPGAIVPYSTAAELEALLIGRWIRIAGPPQLNLETLGLELTDTHEIYALQRAPNGDLQRVEPSAYGVERWSVEILGGALDIATGTAGGGSSLSGAPTFLDQGATMWIMFAYNPGTYSRLAVDAGI